MDPVEVPANVMEEWADFMVARICHHHLTIIVHIEDMAEVVWGVVCI